MHKKKLKKVLIVTNFKKTKVLKDLLKYKRYCDLVIKNPKIKNDKKFILNKFNKFDFLISYANGMIFGEKILNHFHKKKMINFHPSTPRFRGRDTQHFACYYKEKKFGGTIHYLTKKIDSGKIIDTKSYKIKKNSNHYYYRNVSHRAIKFLLNKHFLNILNLKLKLSNEKWSKKKIKRVDFLKKLHIPTNVGFEELKLLIRSFYTKNRKSLYFCINNQKIYFT